MKFTEIVTSKPIVSNAPMGLPPLQVDSTTLVNNLNAERINGLTSNDLLSSDTNSIQDISGSELKIRSTTSTKNFKLVFNDANNSLDFVFSTT